MVGEQLRVQRTNRGDIPKMDLPRLQPAGQVEQQTAGRCAIRTRAKMEGQK
jgi:hypothetical protein